MNRDELNYIYILIHIYIYYRKLYIYIYILYKFIVCIYIYSFVCMNRSSQVRVCSMVDCHMTSLGHVFREKIEKQQGRNGLWCTSSCCFFWRGFAAVFASDNYVCLRDLIGDMWSIISDTTAPLCRFASPMSLTFTACLQAGFFFLCLY